ncbi:ABC transporter permease [Paludibacterium yongneupense]|uniref:ABC transporter permease n=1 Tax=Paludibacterium yongneupense TaxID=400061 RepID=UPI0004002FF6|nr:ABC transporter permease [Paludibacterium yongneupense]
MKLQRVSAIAAREWREIVRDRLFFALAFIVPALLMLLFGYGLSLDVENIPFTVVDYDRSALSRDYSWQFIGSRYFKFQGYSDSESEAGRKLTSGQVRMTLVIPERFGHDLEAPGRAAVQTVIDGTFPSRAMTTRGYVEAINADFSRERLARLPVLSGMKGVVLQSRYLYNQNVSSIRSLAPKLIMVVLMLSPPFLTALGIVREKENGSIFNIYSSDISRGEFLLGKLAPYVAISTFNILTLWCFACLLYQVPFKGDFAFFLLASWIYVLCTTGIGLLVSVLVSTQVAAMIVTLVVTMIPSILYSGLIIPIASLGSGARVVAHIVPAMYYADIVVGCFLKGIGPGALWRQLLVLTAYALILFSLGYALFSKRPRT